MITDPGFKFQVPTLRTQAAFGREFRRLGFNWGEELKVGGFKPTADASARSPGDPFPRAGFRDIHRTRPTGVASIVRSG